MVESATGLVLRVRPLTETSLIVHWLTPTFGRLATVAKGARRPKSSFRGRLDLFYFADFSFSRSRTSELHQLREVSLRHTYGCLRKEIGALQQASYCVRLIEQATETETPLGSIFEMIFNLLQILEEQPPEAPLVFGFELKLLAELGLQPNLDELELSGGAKALIDHFMQADWPRISRLRLTPAQQNELGRFLQGFLLFHLGRVPKGREAAVGAGWASPTPS